MRSSKPVFPPPPPHHQEFLAKLAGKQRAAAGQAESSRPKPEKYVTSLSGVKRPPAQEAVDGAVAELPKTRPQPKQHSSFYAASNKAAAPAVAVVHDDIGKSGASLPTRAASLVATSRAAPADGPLVATPSVPGTTHPAAAAAAAAAGDDSISVNAAGPVLTSPTRTAAGAAAGAVSGAEPHSALLSADQGAARCPRLAPLAVRGGAPRGDFRLQQQAFEFLDAQGADLAPALRVFGRELSADGKRRFLVTSPARLWAEEVEPAAPLGQQQGTAGACGLHLYEIIREGAPCHLYFDLEYVPALNPGVCGDGLVDLLLDLVAEELASSCRVRLPLLGSGVGGGGAAATGAGATSQKDGVSALAVGAAAEGGAAAGAPPGTGAGAVETADDGGAGRDVAVAGSETGPSSSPESAPTTQQVAGTEAAATAVAAGGETQEAAAGRGATAAVVSVVAVVAVGDTAVWASTTATGAAPEAGAASAGEGQVTDMKIDMAEVRLHSGPAAVATGAATPSSSACQPALTALEAVAAAQAGTAAGQDTALSAGTASPVSAPDTAAATATANLDYPADAVAQPVTAVDPSGTGAAQGGSAAPVAPLYAGRVECPWAWELCSTTEAKWSRHLIVRIPHCAFKDNFHVNAFVRRLFDCIAADPQRFAPFFVRRCADPAAPPTLFIDPAVYTRNRAFRLYLSCKAGKTAVLRATPRHAVASLLRRRGLLATAPVHKAPSAGARGSSSTISSSTAISGGVGSALLPPQVEREIAEEVFFATLVTTVGRVDRTLTMYDDSAASHGGAGLNTFHANANAAAAAADAAGGAAAQGATGDAWSGIPRLPLPGLGRGGRGGGGGGGGGGEWRRGPGEAFQYGASPFPEVERFIESVCQEGGVQGRVRSWQHHADSTGGGTATLLLGVRDNRWCANVGRPHRSNGIYYLVDLRGGTWCQRCHDPDCRDFRSAAMPLPADVWEACRPKDTPSPPPAPPAPPAPPQQVCGPARPLGPEPGLAAPAAPQPRLRPSALQFERVGLPCAPAAAPRAATAPWGARTAGNGPGHGNAMDEGIGVGGQGAELGAGITPNGVTTGVGYGIGDVDSDAVFDMMCVEAMERLERQQGW